MISDAKTDRILSVLRFFFYGWLRTTFSSLDVLVMEVRHDKCIYESSG